MAEVTLGILAGGRATRLGGVDKAWLQREGLSQVLRLSERFRPQVVEVVVSANRDLQRHAAAGLRAIADREQDIGPMGGIDALAHACTTPWLLTIPVDLVDINDCLLPSLLAAGNAGTGAYAEDDNGAQPLVALWRVADLRRGLASAIASGDYAVQALQARLQMRLVRLPGVRLGNLNTPADLAAAGIDHP
ncbi:molybdenum cofactor guanylyltransferase [Lysobacter sp. M2-1]|uniref:molybdenum cofactor guanylyltransferase n=1 Tax=Lysobacter sp. M2-1 TaxID=2916839 RepID=UPI001F563BBB|nr:molybdenum cofactor guanylyltransferase [Lysobacter sp. M2-1]